jgi:hypothetical protein
MRALYRTILVAAAASAAALTVIVTAQGAETTTNDQQPSLVEDFAYPNAAQILASDQVQIISGDGHILYTACPIGQDTVGVIQMNTTASVGQAQTKGRVCFKVTGATGEVTVNIPRIYAITGDGLAPGQGHKLKANLTTAAGVRSSVDMPGYGTTQVGVGADPGADPTTLLELIASS